MSTTEKHTFQAEIQQLLDIVIHSLYTDREVFVRELISNASDACERLRFLQASGDQPIQDAEKAPGIVITTDEQAGTLTIADTGVGMTHGDLVENLGTIAHSGTRAFLKQLAEQQKPSAQLIGQFGVGFYSAFMAATRVTVHTRSWQPGESGWRWSSEGANGYELEPEPDLPRGTRVVLELKEDAKEFAKGFALERIIRRYSNFVQFPIELDGKRVNTVQAIWVRQRSEVTEEEYKEFYHYIGHDPVDPLYRLHFAADAPLQIRSLLFVPSQNLETLGLTRTEPEVHLYCRKVLIDPKAKDLLPEWLRFLRGVVDSEDLPLNVSRERMQDSQLLRGLNRVMTKRFLKFLEDEAAKDPAGYDRFYGIYNRFLKEGMLAEHEYREDLGKLLRYESSATEAGKTTSLAEYVTRMPGDQTEVYYLLAASREAAESSPYFEVFKARGQEVLFVHDAIDEFVLDRLMEFEKKPVVAAEKASLKVATPSAGGLSPEAAQGLARWLKETLGDRVGEVRVSERLVDSPAVVLEKDTHLTSSMRRVLKSLQREEVGGGKLDLEINPRHALVVGLEPLREGKPALAVKFAEQLLDSARMAAGLLDDPRVMLHRVNELMTELMPQDQAGQAGAQPAAENRE